MALTKGTQPDMRSAPAIDAVLTFMRYSAGKPQATERADARGIFEGDLLLRGAFCLSSKKSHPLPAVRGGGRGEGPVRRTRRARFPYDDRGCRIRGGRRSHRPGDTRPLERPRPAWRILGPAWLRCT